MLKSKAINKIPNGKKEEPRESWIVNIISDTYFYYVLYLHTFCVVCEVNFKWKAINKSILSLIKNYGVKIKK